MALTDEEYLAWQRDPRNNKYRIALFENDYSGGTVRFGSQAWLSDKNYPYDDWLASLPFMEESLLGSNALGGMNAFNFDDTLNWRYLYWHGHESRWYFGDTRWNFADFRRIATGVIDNVTFQGGRKYTFNLMSATTRLQRMVVDTASSKSHSVAAAIQYFTDETGQTVNLINVSSDKLSWNLAYNVEIDTDAESLLRAFAKSIGAYLRTDQLGNVDLVIPSSVPAATLTEDEITKTGLKMLSAIPPYSKVIVAEDDGTEHEEDTQADTKGLAREIKIETYLSNSSDAQALLAEQVTYYSNPHPIWQAEMMAPSDLVSNGNTIIISHNDLVGHGFVRYAKRLPLTRKMLAEVVL